jgi:hypothetical protein
VSRSKIMLCGSNWTIHEEVNDLACIVFVIVALRNSILSIDTHSFVDIDLLNFSA